MIGDQAGVNGFHAGPNQLLLHPIGQQIDYRRFYFVNNQPVKLQSLQGVGSDTEPVSPLKVFFGLGGDGLKARTVGLQPRMNRPRPQIGQAAVSKRCHGGKYKLSIVKRRWASGRLGQRPSAVDRLPIQGEGAMTSRQGRVIISA